MLKHRHALHRLAAALSMALLAVTSWAGSPTADPAASVDVGTNRLIVKYRGASEARFVNGHLEVQSKAMATAELAARVDTAQRSAQRGGRTMALLKQTAVGAHVFKLDRHLSTAEARQLAAQLKADDAEIEYAEPDTRMFPLLTPNDSSYTSQWDLYDATGGIRAPAAWDRATGLGVVVAVIDTGIRPHADLVGQTVAGYDMIIDTAVSNDGNGRDADPSDPGDWTTAGECGVGSPASGSSWHGTHVAGTIAAKTNNASGIAGIAFNAKVQAVRVLGQCGGYTSDIADAIVWASGGTVAGVPANATPAKVINMSLGGSGACDTTTQNAINGALARGTLTVVAAGNSNANAANFSPASCPGVVTVAATDRNGARAYYSNFGTLVALAAPGGDMRANAANGILSTLNGGTTVPGADSLAYYQGTSMAAPHVAGVAALMFSAKPTATPTEVANALKSSARAFPGVCSGCGTGLLDANAAVLAITGTTPPPPPPPTGSNEVESNNSRNTANLVSAPTTMNGTLASTSDTDYFRISLPAGRAFTATLNPGTRDYDLYLYNSAGTQIASSLNGTGLADTVRFTNGGSAAVTLYVRVRYFSGGAGAYTLGLAW
ncbi:S8 family peptidase [Ideonella sp. A 288]|uniref:S8 family peptidase n=1 Tax=Ideonella sp. A 288 TaxID=1962181 RepID=UPI000B4B3316|nr:S8 family peptidase [Ideonella sp. A 288]